MVSNYLNTISTNVINENSTAVSSENILDISCTDEVAINAKTLCAAENDAIQKDAAATRDLLVTKGNTTDEAMQVYNAIITGKNASAACNACSAKDINQTDTRSITINDSTTNNITSGIKEKIKKDLTTITTQKTVGGITATKAQLNAAQRLTDNIENVITTNVINKTLRVFDAKNVIKGSNVSVSNINQTVAGSVTASNIIVNTIQNNADVMQDVTTLLKAKQDTTGTVLFTWQFALVVFVLCIFAGVVGYMFLTKGTPQGRAASMMSEAADLAEGMESRPPRRNRNYDDRNDDDRDDRSDRGDRDDRDRRPSRRNRIDDYPGYPSSYRPQIPRMRAPIVHRKVPVPDVRRGIQVPLKNYTTTANPRSLEIRWN